jgi:hypothetical protein
VVEEAALDFHDGDEDGFGAVEEREFDARVFVHADGAAESDAALVSLLPLVVEVAKSVVAQGGGAAFDSVGFDVGAEAKSSHGKLLVGYRVPGKTSQVAGPRSQKTASERVPGAGYRVKKVGRQREKGRTEKPKLFSFALFLLPFDLLFSPYFQNSKLGMATVTSRRNLYFEWNDEVAVKMTDFVS